LNGPPLSLAVEGPNLYLGGGVHIGDVQFGDLHQVARWGGALPGRIFLPIVLK
jgi:hypothetical protein